MNRSRKSSVAHEPRMVSLARNESSKQAQFSDDHDFKKAGSFSPDIRAWERVLQTS